LIGSCGPSSLAQDEFDGVLSESEMFDSNGTPPPPRGPPPPLPTLHLSSTEFCPSSSQEQGSARPHATHTLNDPPPETGVSVPLDTGLARLASIGATPQPPFSKLTTNTSKSDGGEGEEKQSSGEDVSAPIAGSAHSVECATSRPQILSMPSVGAIEASDMLAFVHDDLAPDVAADLLEIRAGVPAADERADGREEGGDESLWGENSLPAAPGEHSASAAVGRIHLQNTLSNVPSGQYSQKSALLSFHLVN